MSDTSTTAPPDSDAARQAQDMIARLGQRFAAARKLLKNERPEVRDVAMKRWLSEGSGLTLADLTHWKPDQADTELVPFSQGQQRLCVVLRDGSELRHVVLADPFDDGTRMWLESRIRAAGHPPSVWYVAGANDVAAFYARLERETRALDGSTQAANDATHAAEDAEDVLKLSLAGISTDESPVVRFVNGTLYDALKAQASDIHLECAARGLAVKYRLDGVLQAVARPEGRDFADRVVSRIKVLADLDISERRVPQDGRLKLSYGGRAIDCAVSHHAQPVRRGRRAAHPRPLSAL
jgi:general secretion pathway protein E